ncbi:MAG: GPW/gp25 family protein [Polyangiaceae bacterium]|nr:GPW/gp25 family protein [Polyangiaceae bacterium]
MGLFDEILEGRGPRDSVRSVREEVRAHIEALCTTRHGAIPCDPDYGTEPLTALSAAFDNLMSRWSRTFCESLVRYEPRLREPQVVPKIGKAPDLTVGAEIYGELVVGTETVSTQFTATLSLGGFWSVR